MTAHVAEHRLPVSDLTPAHRVQVGMATFLCSEVAFFSTLIVAYITYIGHSASGPQPDEVLSVPLALVNTIFLLTSSFTVHLAGGALRRGHKGAMLAWLAATIALGAAFLGGTAYEWHDMIVNQGLTISTNLFGTTYYTLVGFHALHVTLGLVLLSLMFALAAGGAVSRERGDGFEVVTWYWHFVDTVWIVVFAVVYVFGR